MQTDPSCGLFPPRPQAAGAQRTAACVAVAVLAGGVGLLGLQGTDPRGSLVVQPLHRPQARPFRTDFGLPATKREIMWGADDEEARRAKAAVEASVTRAAETVRRWTGAFDDGGRRTPRDPRPAPEGSDNAPRDEGEPPVPASEKSPSVARSRPAVAAEDPGGSLPFFLPALLPAPAYLPAPFPQPPLLLPSSPDAGVRSMFGFMLLISIVSQFLEYGVSAFTRNMGAGLLGGLAAALLLYPLDTLRTRRQHAALRGSDPKPEEDREALYRGLPYGLMRHGPSGAFTVATYYAVRSALLPLYLQGDRLGALGVPLAALAAGALAASVLCAPYEILVRRLQVGDPEPTPAGGRWKQLAAVWVAVAARDVPYRVLQLLLFQWFLWPVGALGGPLGVPTVALRLLTAALAGAAAALATLPLDTVVTYLAAGLPTDRRPGVHPALRVLLRPLDAGRAIVRAGGLRALWAAAPLHAALHAPATCLFFLVVELARRS